MCRYRYLKGEQLTLSQYLTTPHPVHLLNSPLPPSPSPPPTPPSLSRSICLFPKHPEHVSSSLGVSKTAENGVCILRTSSPVWISAVAKSPVPMPLGAGAGAVFVCIPGSVGSGSGSDMLRWFSIFSDIGRLVRLLCHLGKYGIYARFWDEYGTALKCMSFKRCLSHQFSRSTEYRIASHTSR